LKYLPRKRARKAKRRLKKTISPTFIKVEYL